MLFYLFLFVLAVLLNPLNSSKLVLMSVGKIAHFNEALFEALAFGALTMCAMWVGNVLKNVRSAKNKKQRVGLSVGFLVLSIFLFSVLSQWFTFNFSMSLSTSYNCW